MDDLEALRADAQHDPDRATLVPLHGADGSAEVEVQPLRLWPDRAFAALEVGDHTAWAADCLTAAGRAAWAAAGPTVRQCREFVSAWEATTGQDLAAVFAMRQALAEHPRQVEADLQRYYRLDVRDLWRPGGGASGLTWRRLRVLVDGLPAESDVKTAYRDAMSDAELAELAKEARGHGPWSATDYRIAAIRDDIHWLIFAVFAAAGGKPKQPDPTPRPGVPDKRRRATPKGVQYLLALQRGHGVAAEGWQGGAA